MFKVWELIFPPVSLIPKLYSVQLLPPSSFEALFSRISNSLLIAQFRDFRAFDVFWVFSAAFHIYAIILFIAILLCFLRYSTWLIILSPLWDSVLAFLFLTSSPWVISSIPMASNTVEAQILILYFHPRLLPTLGRLGFLYVTCWTQRLCSLSISSHSLISVNKTIIHLHLKSETAYSRVIFTIKFFFFFPFWNPSHLFYPLFLICHFSLSIY